MWPDVRLAQQMDCPCQTHNHMHQNAWGTGGDGSAWVGQAKLLGSCFEGSGCPWRVRQTSPWRSSSSIWPPHYTHVLSGVCASWQPHISFRGAYHQLYFQQPSSRNRAHIGLVRREYWSHSCVAKGILRAWQIQLGHHCADPRSSWRDSPYQTPKTSSINATACHSFAAPSTIDTGREGTQKTNFSPETTEAQGGECCTGQPEF